MKYNRVKFRELIKSLTSQELDESLDDFPSVRNQFTDGQERHLRDRIILDYFEKHQEEIDNLLKAIESCNLKAYERYVSELANPEKLEKKSESSNGINSEDQNCDILVLAANPIGTDLLQLEKEANIIREQFTKVKQEKNYLQK